MIVFVRLQVECIASKAGKICSDGGGNWQLLRLETYYFVGDNDEASS